MDDDVTFGQWLRRRRVLDLTQKELAQRAGYGVTTIRKIETGERRPSKELATQLAACLEIALEEYAAFIAFARAEPYTDRPASPATASRPPDSSSGEVAPAPLPPFPAQRPAVLIAHLGSPSPGRCLRKRRNIVVLLNGYASFPLHHAAQPMSQVLDETCRRLLAHRQRFVDAMISF